MIIRSKKEKCPICPVCGEECGEVYYSRWGDVFGCDGCITVRDAWSDPNAMAEKCNYLTDIEE